MYSVPNVIQYGISKHDVGSSTGDRGIYSKDVLEVAGSSIDEYQGDQILPKIPSATVLSGYRPL